MLLRRIHEATGFPREVIAIAVRWKLPYGLSARDVEELAAMRGINADRLTRSANATEPESAP